MAFFDSELTTAGDDSIGGILQEFGNLLQTELINSLQEKGVSGTSGQLQQSIIFDIDFTGSVWRFELSMEDYGKFIDQGVKGIGGNRKTKTLFGDAGSPFPQVAPDSVFSFKPNAKPSAKHFELWARTKGLNPFAVRESVFRKGLKPNYFYSSVVDENLINELVKNLELKGAKALELEIANSIKGNIT